MVVVMENKIMQLLMENGQVSMNNDIFPILFGEFGNAPLNEQTYELAGNFIEQQLYAVYAAGINVVCVPQFSGEPQTGTLFVNDIVYKVVK
jgi:hypothetical protein|nr:MAG TPA: hypothetical protein [Caudoviricetes sp.]